MYVMDIMDAQPILPSKSRIAARYGRAVGVCESAAGMNMDIVKRVAAIVRKEMYEGQLWADLGSGTGKLAENLRETPSTARLVCLDLAFPPLRRAAQSGRAPYAVNADIDNLPFRAESLHGAAVVSVLQWLSSPEKALCGVANALKPNGALCFSAYVDGAFTELVETRTRMGLPQVIWLPTVSELLMAFDLAGFDVQEDRIDHFDRVQRFPDAASALGNLSRLGSTATSGRLLNRSELAELYKDYTMVFGKKGSVPLTYRCIIGTVRKRG
jgi:ubiquinone/menaquinone biosynthesis C-methylase UbiE